MRILLTNATCIQDIIGGASRAVDEIAQSLASNGHNVTVFVPRRNSNKIEEEIISKNYRVVRYRYFNGLLKFLNIFTAYFSFNRIRKENIDIIWGNSPEPWLFIKKSKTKQIYTMHGPWILESSLDNNLSYIKKFIINLLYRYLVNNKTLLHFQSNYVRNICIKEGGDFISNAKTIVAPLLVNEDKIKISKSSSLKVTLDNDKLNILLARRLVNRTGVINFLEMVNKFEPEFKSQLKVFIVGEGYLSNQVHDLCQLNHEFNFLGKITQNNLDYLYSHCDVCCMPSLNAEGFGVSILESLFRKTPVVYTTGGGMDEFLKNILPQYRYNPDDLESLQDILKVCLAKKLKNELKINVQNIDYNFNKTLQQIINNAQ